MQCCNKINWNSKTYTFKKYFKDLINSKIYPWIFYNNILYYIRCTVSVYTVYTPNCVIFYVNLQHRVLKYFQKLKNGLISSFNEHFFFFTNIFMTRSMRNTCSNTLYGLLQRVNHTICVNYRHRDICRWGSLIRDHS